MNKEYIDKLITTREKCREILTQNGLPVGDMRHEIGLTISLTHFGLDCAYANLPQDEIEYIADNEVEL